MPERNTVPWRMELLPDAERMAIHARQYQRHWYAWLAPRVSGLTVLDVGAGDGYGLDIMGGCAAIVEGIDLASSGPVLKRDISECADLSFDVVTAVDTIEHVGTVAVDAHYFLHHMLRVARRWVFFSTPNWNVSHGENTYHVREFSPAELRTLLDGLHYEAWCSGGECEVRWLDAIRDDEIVANFGIIIYKGSIE